VRKKRKRGKAGGVLIHGRPHKSRRGNIQRWKAACMKREEMRREKAGCLYILFNFVRGAGAFRGPGLFLFKEKGGGKGGRKGFAEIRNRAAHVVSQKSTCPWATVRTDWRKLQGGGGGRYEGGIKLKVLNDGGGIRLPGRPCDPN